MAEEIRILNKSTGDKIASQDVGVNASPENTPSKELWQMTRAEYEALHGRLRTNTTVTGRFSPHKNAVETALNRGLPVPKEVLADYPSLAEK